MAYPSQRKTEIMGMILALIDDAEPCLNGDEYEDLCLNISMITAARADAVRQDRRDKKQEVGN